MKIRMIYPSLDLIPEDLRKDAVEENGQFVLDGEGLTTKVTELLGKNKQYKGVYDKFSTLGDNVSADQIKQALKEMQDADKREAEVNDRIRLAVAENNKARQKEVDDAKAAADKMKAALEGEIIDGSLTKEVAAAEGDPFFVNQALRSSLKTFEENGKYVVKVVGPDGKPRLNAKNGEPMTITDLVGEAKADKKFAGVFKAPAASGSSATTGNANPNAGVASVVKLTRAEATNAPTYRAAMEKAGGDATKIQITD